MAGRRLALVVATDAYDDPTLQRLAAPAADAAALAEVLGDAHLGGFDVDVVANATSSVIAERVEGLLSEGRPSDLLLLHFSCHGLKDDTGELYLAAANTSPRRLASTAVDAALVNRLMRRSPAKRVVLMLDCCYGGAFERGVVTRADPDVHVGDQFSQERLGGGRGRVVITASSAMEYAFEGTELAAGDKPAPSLFTGALVEGLRSGEADRDRDGHVSLDELYDYIYETVQERTPNQTPSKWEFGLQGELIIARNPQRHVVPAPLPPALAEKVTASSVETRLDAVGALAEQALGSDLPAAAGAAAALRELLEDDSTRVREAARTALEKVTPRVSVPAVDLGRVPVGRPSTAIHVDVKGSPLALASTVETSRPEVRGGLYGSRLRILVCAPTVGPLTGEVVLAGPAGETAVQVSAVVVEPSSPPLGPEGTGDAGETRPNLALVVPLVLAGAAAIIAANFLPATYQGFTALGVTQGIGWFFVPPVVAALAGLALASDRYRPVAVGLIAGAGAWSGAFWLRTTVQGIAAEGPALTVQGTLNTGLWARLVAFLLLTAATVVVVAGSPSLRRPVVLRLDAWAVVAAAMVVLGAFMAVLDLATRSAAGGAMPREVTGAVVTAALCLPVAVLIFGSRQRLAALAAVTGFLFFTGARDAWLIPSVSARSHFAATVTGLLIVLAGCYLNQAHVRRTSMPSAPESVSP